MAKCKSPSNTLEPAADADVIKFINMNITNNAAALAGSHQLSHPADGQLCREGHSDSISCNSTREKKLTGVTVFALEFIAVVLLVSAVAIEVAIEETGHVRISRAQSLVLRERRDQLKGQIYFTVTNSKFWKSLLGSLWRAIFIDVDFGL